MLRYVFLYLIIFNLPGTTILDFYVGEGTNPRTTQELMTSCFMCVYYVNFLIVADIKHSLALLKFALININNLCSDILFYF